MLTELYSLLIQSLQYLFGYLKTNTFPNPLDKEEEEKYIALMKHGDQEARNKLIEHNLRLVAHIVKKYDIKKDQTEDLISIGTIGLIKGIDSFDSDKGHKITTYISRCIENAMFTLRN